MDVPVPVGLPPEGACAIPRSVTTASPCSSNMMLSGLMSRCTMPLLCAYARARATCTRICRISAGGSVLRAASTDESGLPRRNFMTRSEEHTSELQSQSNLVCRLLLEKKKKKATRCSGAYEGQQV